MKRVYIAGKIGELDSTVWSKNFQIARDEVKELGFEPICPTQQPHAHDRTWQSYMREDLKALLSCEAIYAQKNWMDSPGATIEVHLARALGIEIIYQA